jgi:uncharacterized protein YkwD
LNVCRAWVALFLVAVLSGTVANAQSKADAASVRPAWADEILEAHNAIRSRLNLPPLVWSAKLAAIAQEWAEGLASRREFAHRPKGSYGENLFEMTGARASPDRVVEEWASEARDYDYARNACRGVCGHYTQIVWRDTRELGCGRAVRGAREVWVCNYSPPGNRIGRRPY